MVRRRRGRQTVGHEAGWLIALALGVLLLSGCAGSGGLLETELPDDGRAPPTSAASARLFAQKAVKAGEVAAETGRFELSVTDVEVTSFLNVGSLLLGQFQTLSNEDLEQLEAIPELEGVEIGELQDLLEQRERLPGARNGRLRLRLTIEDPAVHFRGTGEVIVRGSARFLILRVPVRVVTAPRASEGELVLDFVEGQMGRAPMPELVFDLVGRGLSSALLMGQEYARISEISVGDGTLTVRGSYAR